MEKQDLENRLVRFVVLIKSVINGFTGNRFSELLSDQILRASLSVALNYGEAQSAESRKDFIHKMQIALKELRETYIGLKIAYKGDLYKNPGNLSIALDECNQLISISLKASKLQKTD